MTQNGNIKVYDQLHDEVHNMTVGELSDWIDKNVTDKTDKKHTQETLSELIKLFCLTEFDKRFD